jgi:hypothetical protein
VLPDTSWRAKHRQPLPEVATIVSENLMLHNGAIFPFFTHDKLETFSLLLHRFFGGFAFSMLNFFLHGKSISFPSVLCWLLYRRARGDK